IPQSSSPSQAAQAPQESCRCWSVGYQARSESANLRSVRPRRLADSLRAWEHLRTARHGFADLALRFGLLLIFALVVQLLAVGNGQLDLGPAVLEVHSQGNEGEAALRGLGGELGDLAAVQQQLARPLRLVIQPVAHRVFGDVAAEQPHFAVLDLGISVFEVAR